MSQQRIIMNFTAPPSADDLAVIAEAVIDTLPEELMEFCDSLAIQIEELADESLENDLDLEDAFDLVALYRSGGQIAPGVEKKVANDEDLLILFRRPLLDLWCETCDELNDIVRQVMIEELGQNFDFSEDEIDEMTRRHYQGML
ncbi:MAG: metallopeptidase family protein [Rhodospirillales bacterium]|nr:metallopeptidase family protein [Rhodospirillales bacterium]MCB9995225.1 metallopeptidase family protein [Rhodospirillales bacterium]